MQPFFVFIRITTITNNYINVHSCDHYHDFNIYEGNQD